MSKWAAFGIRMRECGGGGDCLFHCIGVAVGKPMERVREWLAHTITPHNLSRFHARVGTVQQTQMHVRTNGWTYIGTDDTLQWMARKSHLGFVVLSSFGPDFTTVIQNEHSTKYLMLYNIANSHWQLAYLGSSPFLTRDSVLKLLVMFRNSQK